MRPAETPAMLPAEASPQPAVGRLWPVYLGLGIAFGVLLYGGQVLSWYRIQEMFRFQSFHMYGVLGSAWLVAFLGMGWMRSRKGGTWSGEGVRIEPKERTPGLVRYWAGGLLFGMGWALLGACPGPLYGLVGAGETAYLVALVAAVAGTWLYGHLRPRLPH